MLPVLQVLGKNHVIKDLKKCDFTPMYEYAMAERERKKQLSKEVCSLFPRITVQRTASDHMHGALLTSFVACYLHSMVPFAP